MDEVSAAELTPPSDVELQYNPKVPIETLDVIVVDECHRSIYWAWRQVLEYFDAFLIGPTATPSKQTLGFIAEAYDWAPDELAEFADLIGVQIDQEPTWGQQQEAIGAAIRERRRVDDLMGVLLAMHALRIEPTLADEDWNQEGAALVAFLTSQGYKPSPVESELMGGIVPMRASEAANPQGELPSGEEDAST